MGKPSERARNEAYLQGKFDLLGGQQHVEFLEAGALGAMSILGLLDRIRDGQEKLWNRWQLIRQMPGGGGRDKYLEGWDRAIEKLKGLAGELAALGYKHCIYEGKTQISPCFVCTVPNELWQREKCPAWEEEL